MVEIIAEIGVNHQGNMGIAKELITKAKQAGATAVKAQLYDVGKLFPEKQIVTQGKNWYNEVKKTQLTKEQMDELVSFGQSVDIEVFFSVFDTERLGWLKGSGIKRVKLGCQSCSDVELLNAVACSPYEVMASVPYGDFSRTKYNALISQRPQVKWLYCVPEYPAVHRNLSKILFGKVFYGFSDHSLGVLSPVVVVSRGALMIEKHLTLDRNMPGPDHFCSLEPQDFKDMVDMIHQVEGAL